MLSAGDVAELGSPVEALQGDGSPGATVRRDHHLVGDPVRRPGSMVRVIEGECVVQSSNRSRYPAGQQSLLIR
ncbi:hypothetical protein KAM385_45780 [Aeromonas hydrophila]|nr:hypothetical protein KAM385_45780 [Aeromonas hydrophila]